MSRDGKSDIVDVAYESIKIDDDKYRSILFVIGGEDIWLPRSLIEVDVDAKTVAVPRWKVEKDGLDESVV